MPLFQNESKYATFLMKMSSTRSHFRMKDFPLRLALKQRHQRTRKWPVSIDHTAGTALSVLATFVVY